MHLQYESYEDILSDSKGFGRKIVEEIVDNIVEQVMAYCQKQKLYYANTYGIELVMHYDVLRANQAIIDTLEDLMRLKEFHPVQYPNRLKCAAYLSYWWLQRQPLTFEVPNAQQNTFFSKVSKEDIAKLIHTNAYWLVAYVFGELFFPDELPCREDSFEKQWDIAFGYIFYFFCYRASSPKAIEAFLATTVLHPIWKVKEGVYIEE